MVETQVKLLTTEDIADFINEYSGLDIRDGKVGGDAPFYKYCYYYLSTKYIPLIPYSQLAIEINQKHSSVVAGLKTLQDLTDIYKKYRIPLYKIDNEFKERFKELIDKDVFISLDMGKLKKHRQIVKIQKQNKKLSAVNFNVTKRNKVLRERCYKLRNGMKQLLKLKT